MGDDDLIVERRVSVAPEKVFAYFTDPEKWTAWQGTEAEIELVPGGTWRVNVTGDGFASGRVVEVVPNERVVFTWGWEQGPPVPPGSTNVAIDLVPDGDGTLIRLTHSGLPPDEIEIHRYGWEHYIPRLAAVSEGRDPDRTSRRDDMEVDVVTEIEIDRPRDEVAAYASDPDNATKWYRNIKRVEWESPVGSIQVGSRIAFEAEFLGRKIAYTYEIRELVPNESFVMATAEGPFPMETTYSWSDTATGGTKMQLRNRGSPSGFGKMAAPMMKAAMRRANTKDLVLLKEILEGRNATDL